MFRSEPAKLLAILNQKRIGYAYVTNAQEFGLQINSDKYGRVASDIRSLFRKEGKYYVPK
jgi:hypothetical protein